MPPVSAEVSTGSNISHDNCTATGTLSDDHVSALTLYLNANYPLGDLKSYASFQLPSEALLSVWDKTFKSWSYLLILIAVVVSRNWLGIFSL